MTQRDEDSPDREAILARRRHFIARALPGRELMVVAVSGLATACPCLSIGVPEDTGEPTTSTGDETATSTGDETSTSTGTETSTETGDETGETGDETEGPS